MNHRLLLFAGNRPTPVGPPTRDELLGGQCSFQGLTAQTDAYGAMPLFDPAIAWLKTRKDRLACYATKRAAGDSIVVLAASGQYQEPWDPANWYNRMPGRDFVTEGRMSEFADLIAEATSDGGMRGVEVWCGGDGLGFDPNGLTHGYDWLMANYADNIYAPLESVAPFIKWQAGADGWIPGWAGDQDQWDRVETWLLHARSVIGAGALGAYLSAGYWCWTEANRYLSPGGREVDYVVYETPCPMGPPNPPPPDFCNQSNRSPWDQVWQISNRILGPKYRRPSDQPACDDDKRFSEQIPDNARGNVYRECREFDTFDWVRGRISADGVEAHRAYLRDIGWEHIG